MNIGLFGGTFNPIHIGHLLSANYVLSQFNLDEIYFIPSYIPPHKKGVMSSNHRKNMVHLAVANNPKFRCSIVEIERQNKSYTIDTLNQFKYELPDKNLYYLIGLDAFLEITTWKDYKKLFDLCSFIVINRKCLNPEQTFREGLNKILNEVNENLKFQIITSGDHSIQRMIPDQNIDIYFVQFPYIGISSTKIRLMKSCGFSIRYQVEDSVHRYIEDNNLYKL